MSQELKSQLSALMDGELEKDASRFLLKRLPGDTELSSDWARWHLIRDCMNGRQTSPGALDLAARVAAALEQDATPRRSVAGTVTRWAAGAAIAASVAVAALLALPSLPDSNSVQGPAVAAGDSGRAEVVPSGLTERDLRPASLAPVAHSVSATQRMSLPPAVQVDPRVDAWLIRHSNAPLRAQGQSFDAYLPVVSPHRPSPQRVRVDSSELEHR